MSIAFSLKHGHGMAAAVLALLMLGGGSARAVTGETILVASRTSSNNVTVEYRRTQYRGGAEFLEKAINDATANVGDVVTLYEDIDFDDKCLEIKKGTEGTSLTLDLNGHKINGDGDYTLQVGELMTVEIVDKASGGSIVNTHDRGTALENEGTVAIKGGKFVCTGQGGIAIANYNILTTSNCSVDGGYGGRCIHNFGGYLTVGSGTQITADSGTGIENYTPYTATIEGGTISGCNRGIRHESGTLTMKSLSVFGTANGVDIELERDMKIEFGNGQLTAPASSLKVSIDEANLSMAFTQGFANTGLNAASTFRLASTGNDNEAVMTEYCGQKDIKFSAEGFATQWSLNNDMEMERGMTAWIVSGTHDNGEKLTYQKIADGNAASASDRVVPSGTAVLLQVAKATADRVFSIKLLPGTNGNYNSNMLYGQNYTAYTFGGKFYYKLSYDDNGENFGWYYGIHGGDKFICPANKVWLAIPESSNARLFALPGDGAVTGVKDRKYYNDGASPDWYTASGIRLNAKPTRPGVYVNADKKVIVTK